MKRVVLYRTDASGGLTLTLPVARSIKESSSDLHVTILVSEYTQPLLREAGQALVPTGAASERRLLSESVDRPSRSIVNWGPRGKSNKLFVPKVDSDRSDSAEVMDSISVEAVFDFALSKLQFDSRLEPR